jgi:hypothetical protein
MKNVTFEATTYGKLIHYTDAAGERQTNEFLGATADEWLGICDYGPTRLLALLDLEARLRGAGKGSPKMAAVRVWLDGVLSAFVVSPESKQDWLPAPYAFEETTQEAFAALVA